MIIADFHGPAVQLLFPQPNAHEKVLARTAGLAQDVKYHTKEERKFAYPLY